MHRTKQKRCRHPVQIGPVRLSRSPRNSSFPPNHPVPAPTPLPCRWNPLDNSKFDAGVRLLLWHRPTTAGPCHLQQSGWYPTPRIRLRPIGNCRYRLQVQCRQNPPGSGIRWRSYPMRRFGLERPVSALPRWSPIRRAFGRASPANQVCPLVSSDPPRFPQPATYPIQPPLQRPISNPMLDWTRAGRRWHRQTQKRRCD